MEDFSTSECWFFFDSFNGDVGRQHAATPERRSWSEDVRGRGLIASSN
jgi:hypothetical protein